MHDTDVIFRIVMRVCACIWGGMGEGGGGGGGWGGEFRSCYVIWIECKGLYVVFIQRFNNGAGKLAHR